MPDKNTEELITEAKLFFETYKKEIGESIRKGKKTVFINFEDLSSNSPILAEALISQPEEILQLLETALEESGLIKTPRIRFNDLPETQKVRIRTIRAEHLNQLIYFEGLVRQASEVRPQVVNAKFECPSCGTVISVLQIEKKFREPSRCSCGRKGQFRLISKVMVDAQRLVIEESPESLTGGEQPRRINVFLKEDLVEPIMEEKTTPGSKVRILGILKEVPVPLPSGAISTRFDLAIEASNIIPLEATYEELDITEEDERQIEELAADPELFTKLRDSVAPSIWGYEEIKEALVLQMFSGVRKVSDDGSISRGDIHLFLIGDPGVAKSVGKNEKILYIHGKEFGYKSIEKLFEEYERFPKNLKTLTINMKNHKPQWEKVHEIIKHKPEKKLIKITTEHGKQITATLDHSFITLSDNGEIIPIKGEQLNKNSYLPLPINFHKEILKEIETKKFNTYKTNSKQLPKKIKLDEDFGFFIGIFLSEGNISSGKHIQISNKNQKIKQKVKNFIEKIDFKTDKKQTLGISISSKSMSNLLRFNCYNQELVNKVTSKVKGNYSRIKKIPDFAYFAPRKFLKGIISGIFSGDGRFIKDKKRIKGLELITISKQLAQGTSDILFSIGILNKIKKRNYTYKNNKADYYIISISSQMIKKFRKNFKFYGREYINYPKPIYSYNNCIPCGNLVYELTKKLGYNSRISGNRILAAEMRTVKTRNKIGRLRLRRILKEFQRKSDKDLEEFNILKKIAYSPIIWSKIEKVEKIQDKNQDVYDLSIPTTNTFVANGLGVHNSLTLKFISDIAPKGRYIVGKAASLEYNEPLIIKENNKIKFVEIGEFVDSYYNKNETGFAICNKSIEALSLNNKTLKLEWKPLRAVFRHKNKDNLLRFHLETGRKITVTQDHSIFYIKKGEIKCKSSQELKQDDYVIVPMNIPSNEQELSIDISKFLGYFIAEGRLYNKDGSYKVQFTLNKNEIDIIQDIRSVSERYFDKAINLAKHGDNAVRLTIYGKKAYHTVCSWLGNIAHKKAKEKGIPEIILNSNKEARKGFFDSYIKGDSGVTKSQKLMSELLYMLLQDKIIGSCVEREDNSISILKNGRKIIGKGKRFDLIAPIPQKKFQNTRINFPIACLSDNLKIFFKRKLKQGYNRINLDRIDNNTHFQRILRIYKDKKIKGKELRILFGEKSLDYFRKHKEWFVKRKKGREAEFSLTKKGLKIGKDIMHFKKLLESDVTFVKIKNIEKVKPNKKFVYDVSTPEDENFVAGFGGVVCHNTGAGITATVVRDEFLKGWSLEAGAMVLANKGVICIDEIEKMDPTDRSAMHEALEQQTVTISKANVQASLQAQTSVLAAGNPKFGRFEPLQSITQQIDLPPALINRFDLIFVLRDLPNKSQDDAIATHVLNMHQMKGKKSEIERDLFKKYIAYAKQKIEPKLTEDAVEEIKNYYVKLRNMQSSGDAQSIPISARQLQGLVRLAEAHAKSRLSSTVDKEDSQVAIRLTNYYLMQVGYDPETKTFDIDRFSTRVSSSQRSKIMLLKETIKKLEDKYGKQIPLDVLRQEMQEFSDQEFEESLEKLKKSGDIFQPKKGFVQDVQSR